MKVVVKIHARYQAALGRAVNVDEPARKDAADRKNLAAVEYGSAAIKGFKLGIHIRSAQTEVGGRYDHCDVAQRKALKAADDFTRPF